MTNNNEFETLGRRAVECKHWRWLPGMLAIVPAAHDGATGYCYRLTEASGPVNSARAYPDVTDAATRGCILELVRKAWADSTVSIWFDSYSDWNFTVKELDFYCYETEIAAIISALENADRSVIK